MNHNGNPNRIERKITFVKDIIIDKCERLETKEEKVIYLKKIINDCERIIHLAEIFAGGSFDRNYVRNALPNVDDNLLILLDGESEPPEGEIPFLVKQPTYYLTPDINVNRVCDIHITIDTFNNVKECSMDQLLNVERIENDQEKSIMDAGDKIKIRTGKSVIVRIFECMKKAGIIWSETPTKDIAELFFSDVLSKIKFEKSYNAAKNRIEKEESSTNSPELFDFVLLLIEKSFSGKNRELSKIIKHAEHLQKNII